MAALIDEPARPVVESLLRKQPPPSISAVNLSEAIDTLVRGRGHPEEVVRERIDLLMIGGLEVEPVWVRVARLAASLRAQHYHREKAAVSLADCMCLATAMALETDLATTDPALARMARQAGVAVIALPDSTGKVP